MAIKTISLELDAYEKLNRAKRGKESFSSVVRRARFGAEEATGESILEEYGKAYGRKRSPVTRKTLEYWNRAAEQDAEAPRVSPSHWKE